jgi:CPA1 family monovalent cation:H+ antiporter
VIVGPLIAAVHRPLLVAVALAAVVLASAWVAKRSRIPTPVFFVLTGLAVSFVPGVQEIKLPPDVVFYGFLPPLLYAAAFFVSPREARENWASILVLAVGLTLVTLLAVGFVGWWLVPALGAGGAFLLGAVLGPTDPVSATSVIGQTSAPEKLQTILEGESLVNDGIGLVAFSIALTAVEKGTFSVAEGVLKFVQVAAGGVAFGLLVAFVVERIRRRVHDADIEIPLSVLTPYVAYIPAERLGFSGILATVTCGVYLGWRSGGIFRPEVRLQSIAFWDAFNFTLTAVLFVLLGLQFRPVVHSLPDVGWTTLLRDALVVFAVLTVVRMAWMFTVPYLVGRWRDIAPWQDRLILGWSGMRGALSLAAALSIPVAVAQRDHVLYLTFTTILAGLLVLAVPLPWLLEAVGFGATGDDTDEQEARIALLRAGLARLDELGIADDHGIRRLYESRLERLSGDAERIDEHVDLRREVLGAERAELHRLEREGGLGFAAARRLERQLDLEEASLRR